MKRCLFSMLALAVVLFSSFTAPTNFVDLSKSGTANCYIVSQSGYYKLRAVKGNSNVSVGSVSSATVLWESFGTDDEPSVGALIKNIVFNNGYVLFQTADIFKEGNAVIAAMDASGKILWSWHIWLTDQPKGQVYYNNAGTMMDRNLGATSATPGDVGALGLLYQWGRKDPFLGSSYIYFDNIKVARSTITWPSTVESNSSNGTIAYATAHPTTFITGNDSNNDWYYNGSSSTNNTRWTTSETSKSIYDPCPVGWRVPDGGRNGVWAKAGFDDTEFDGINAGILFSISSPSQTWFPATGYLEPTYGELLVVGDYGNNWSASPHGNDAYGLCFNIDSRVYPLGGGCRAFGFPVRCVKGK